MSRKVVYAERATTTLFVALNASRRGCGGSRLARGCGGSRLALSRTARGIIRTESYSVLARSARIRRCSLDLSILFPDAAYYALPMFHAAIQCLSIDKLEKSGSPAAWSYSPFMTVHGPTPRLLIRKERGRQNIMNSKFKRRCLMLHLRVDRSL